LTPADTAKKKLKTTVIFNGTLSNCTGTQAGTKKGAQIDGGTLVGKGKTTTAVGAELPSCAGLTAPTTPTVLKTTVKFTSVGKTIATSKVNLTIGAAGVDGSLTLSFRPSGTVSGGNAFKGATMTANAILDERAPDLDSVCAPGASTTFNFTGVEGESTLQVP
jgi:hypothetical protein